MSEAERPEPGPPSAEPAIDVLARDVLPALVARLATSRLGEIEVAADGWRVRLRRAPGASGAARTDASGEPVVDDGPVVATSPGVGYFDPGPNLEVGTRVTAGDRLGSVEVLGIAQEVVAPTDGVIGRLHARAGEAVEYGQPLATIGDVHLSDDEPGDPTDGDDRA